MKTYLSLIKFAHTVFALPFAFLAAFMGLEITGGQFDALILLKILLCMVFARTAAMAFNRYVDRKIDALNQRTVIREIPSGKIKPAAALQLVIFSSLAFVSVAYWINPLCFMLSPIALAVVLGYSYTKRFTWLCHFVLGLGLGLAPVGAYIAVTGHFDVLPVTYGIMVLLWVSGFDILYALQDESFDREQGLHSVPQPFGQQKAKQISLVLHMICAVLLIWISREQAEIFPSLYYLHWIAAFGFILLLARQHYLVFRYNLARINKAFFETNGIASVMFGILVIVDVLT